MSTIKKFFTLLIVYFTFITFSYGQDKIVYLDLDNLVSNTKAGKKILSKLENTKKETLLKFEKEEKDLKNIENDIKKKKYYN